MSRGAARFGALLAAGVILLLTLLPMGEVAEPHFACLLCGSTWLADAVNNVALFVPLGLLLSIAGVPLRRVALAAAALSAGIEAAQLLLPSRYPSGGDILMNAAGGVIGAWVPRAVAWLAAARGVGVAGVTSLTPWALVLVTRVLVQPVVPTDTPLWGQWTPRLGHLFWYRGRVDAASLGPLPLPGRRLDAAHAVALTAGQPMEIRARAGPPAPRLGPLLSIYDGWQREVLLIGPDRGDLVVRWRTRSRALGLDAPDLRWRGVGAPPPGSPLTLRLERDGVRWRLGLNGVTATRVPALAQGWGFFYFPERLAGWPHGLFGLGWIAAWYLPLGVCVSRRRRTVSIVTAVVALAALGAAPLAGLAAPGAADVVGAALGLVCGRAAGRACPQD